MRILANENVPGEAVSLLRAEGHDVASIALEAPGATDETVLARAVTENRILLTFDKDFGELAFAHAPAGIPGVILVRFLPSSPSRTARLLSAALLSRTDWPGHFAVIEAHRVRMTPLPHR